ncbi:MAG: RelA/SpoT family protein [Cytophagales bacterium]|nr:RelA/SpoT family protein [Bernardetiaceae bacterium]MDW8209828.1 RelA/SpoT family protein [Cytophagales bacterium]
MKTPVQNFHSEQGTAPQSQVSSSKPMPLFLATEEQYEKEEREIERRYNYILQKVRPVLKNPQEDEKRIRSAFEMAKEAHQNMRRKSGEPYIYHPLEVARIVVEEMGLGATSVICAFLHDVVEDTDITLEEIQRQFGEKEARIIDGLTKIKNVNLENGTTEQVENFRKVLVSISQDVRVVLIKIADRLHNMRTLGEMRRDQQLRTISETQLIYAPLAHRLGLYEIKSELEDLCLKYTHPEIYQEIATKIKKTQPAREEFIKDFIRPIEEKLREYGFNFVIKSRVKSISSIYNKMQTQKLPFEAIYDLFAIRIILDSPIEKEINDCWAAYSIVTDFYQPNPERTRQWLTTPRPNGYQALHTTVMSNKGQWVEVQIRSKRMDEIAEKGLAAHWRYKDKSPQSAKRSLTVMEEWLNRLREILENRDLNALEMINEVYKELNSEEIYVFTPKGEMKILRKGSTVLDFAFTIHTELGLHCLGAKVNGVNQSISYELKNGETVEIIKSKFPRANLDWLHIAKNKRTQSKILQFLKRIKNASAQKGQEIIKRKIEQMNLNIPFTEQFRLQLAKKFGYNNSLEFEEKLGRDEIPHTQIKEAIRELLERSKKNTPATNEQIEKVIKNIKKNGAKLIIDGHSDNIPYVLAQCCSPVKGDEVIGYITVNHRLMVHRIDCINAINQMAKDNSRVIPIAWAEENTPSDQKQAQAQQPAIEQIASLLAPSSEPLPHQVTHSITPPTPAYYEAILEMNGFDRDGIVNEVTQMIHANQANMRAITMGAHDGLFEGQIVVRVKDTHQLENLIKDLQTIEGVINVTRRVL